MLQVFQNLMKNAAEAANPRTGGVIRLHTFYDLALRLRRPDGSGAPLPLQVEIIDDGPGLPPERRAEVIRRGARLDESAPGSGLGLSIVDELARAYGGTLRLGDSPLGGLSVELELPSAES